MSKRFNPNRIKINSSYTVKDISEVLGVNPKTVRNWIRVGLPVIDDKRPLLIQGADLKLYLKQKYKTYLHNCELNQMFCMKCKEPKEPNVESIHFIAKPAGMARMTGCCGECGIRSNKFVSWRDVNQIWTDLGGNLPIAEKHLILKAQTPFNFPLS